MLIDLSNVLSEPHRSVDETVPCELKIFRNGLGEYPVTESSDVHVKINYMENGKLQIEGTCKLTVEIPCDRCLENILHLVIITDIHPSVFRRKGVNNQINNFFTIVLD